MKKRIAALVFALLMVLGAAAPALAAPPSRSYMYDWYGMAVPSPEPYSFSSEIYGNAYFVDGESIGDFSNPSDAAVDTDDNIYVADLGNGRVVIFNKEKELVRILKEYTYNGETLSLMAPVGMFVYEHFGRRDLYVADSHNNLIIRFDVREELSGETPVAGVIEADNITYPPEISELRDGAEYKPHKIVVDRAGRIFVSCMTISQGIVRLSPDGSFSSFFGAPEVTISGYQKLMRKVLPEVIYNEYFPMQDPPTYSNITLDSKGFVYATSWTINQQALYNSFWTLPDIPGQTARAKVAPIRKLAADGTDILTRAGTFPPVGDIGIGYSFGASSYADIMGNSKFNDVTVNSYNIYSVLDSGRRKVFTYDYDGNMLFVFSSRGNKQHGTISIPTAISYFGENEILVLDSDLKCLSIYTPTDYGRAVLGAVEAYSDGNYEESERLWGEVVKRNSNMTEAYTGVGKSLMRSGDYKGAMAAFKVSKNTTYYSSALEDYLSGAIGDKFTYIFLVVVGAALVYTVYKWIRRFRLFLREGVKKVV